MPSFLRRSCSNFDWKTLRWSGQLPFLETMSLERELEISCVVSQHRTRRTEQRSRILLEFFKSGRAVPSEPLSPEQNAVLHLLFIVVHGHEGFDITISKLSKGVNNHLKLKGEGLHLQPRNFGRSDLDGLFRSETDEHGLEDPIGLQGCRTDSSIGGVLRHRWTRG